MTETLMGAAKSTITKLADQIPALLCLCVIVVLGMNALDHQSLAYRDAIEKQALTFKESLERVETQQTERVRNYTQLLDRLGNTIDAAQKDTVMAQRENTRIIGENTKVLENVSRLLQRGG